MHAPAQEDTVPAMPIRLRGEPRLADPDEDEEADGRSASLGAVLHWALSLKHFLTRRRVAGPELVGGRRGRRVGIGDVLARLGREDEADEDMAPPGRRREPPLSARTAPRADARRPHEAIALDEDEDEAEAEPDQEDDDEEADIAEAAPRVGKRRPISAAEAARRNEPASSASPRIAPPPSAPKPGRRLVRDREPSLPYEEDYEYPPITLLSEPRKQAGTAISPDALEANARLLEGVLEDFGVRGEIIHVRPGPVVTLYELEPAPGIKSSRVIGLADDIARSMSALSARVAVVPGRNVIGIELPNAEARDGVFSRTDRLARTSRPPSSSWRCASARPSAASRSSPSSPGCRICWSPAPPARASRWPSTP